VQCRAIALVLFDRLVARASELAEPTADTGWIETGRREVDRLAAAYRVPGDDQVAYPVEPVDDTSSDRADDSKFGERPSPA
jgi:hypothetical protein